MNEYLLLLLVSRGMISRDKSRMIITKDKIDA